MFSSRGVLLDHVGAVQFIVVMIAPLMCIRSQEKPQIYDCRLILMLRNAAINVAISILQNLIGGIVMSP